MARMVHPLNMTQCGRHTALQILYSTKDEERGLLTRIDPVALPNIIIKKEQDLEIGEQIGLTILKKLNRRGSELVYFTLAFNGKDKEVAQNAPANSLVNSISQNRTCNN